jgi:hypothetical protein
MTFVTARHLDGLNQILLHGGCFWPTLGGLPGCVLNQVQQR